MRVPVPPGSEGLSIDTHAGPDRGSLVQVINRELGNALSGRRSGPGQLTASPVASPTHKDPSVVLPPLTIPDDAPAPAATSSTKRPNRRRGSPTPPSSASPSGTVVGGGGVRRAHERSAGVVGVVERLGREAG
ncbi:hypothetical protein THAOC_27352, partial [Thalassiosira oceanica]